MLKNVKTILLSSSILLVFGVNSLCSTPYAEKPRTRVLFKHGGCVHAVGICIIQSYPKPKPGKPIDFFTPEETSEGWGMASLEMLSSDKLIIIPERQAHQSSNQVVPITEEIIISGELATQLGYSKITIQTGNYPINLEEGNGFGRVTVNVTTIP